MAGHNGYDEDSGGKLEKKGSNFVSEAANKIYCGSA
jgi:hypothetical protein